SQFKREVRGMGLELANANLIKRHRDCFKSLKRGMNRNPSVEEFAREARAKLSKFRKPLRDANLHEFVEYLGSPFGPDSLTMWNHTDEGKHVVRTVLKK